MIHRDTRIVRLVGLLLAIVLVGAACDDSGNDDEGTSEDAPTEEEAPENGDAAEAEGETVEVTSVDYAFEGVPDQVAPGTSFTLQNDSEGEVHEIVALRIDDDEERPVEELLALPEEEQQEVAEVRGVTVAFPGESGQFPAPAVTLEQPGRYLLACFIPLGADPDEYAEAAQAQTEPGPVEVDGGPPHITEGMFAEITVG